MKPSASIATFRSWLGITQGEMARACGVSRGTVTRWEAGTAVPPPWLVKALEWAGEAAFSVSGPAVVPSQDAQEARAWVLGATRGYAKATKRKGGRPRVAHPLYTLALLVMSRGVVDSVSRPLLTRWSTPAARPR